MGRRRIVVGILFVLVACGQVACSQRTSLADYKPGSKAEAEIKTLLIKYLDAKRHHDIAGYLACLHPDGRYAFECGRMLSKAELGELLPGFWADMRSGDPAFYPINRECITGDYFDSGRYVRPRMEVGGHTASVIMKFTVGWWGLHHYVTLFRSDRGWLISGLDWEMN